FHSYLDRIVARPSHPSDLEHLLELRQIARTVAGNMSHILETNAANFGIIQARFDGHDMTGAQDIIPGRAQSRSFVDLQAQPVARAMEETLHAAVALAGLVPL